MFFTSRNTTPGQEKGGNAFFWKREEAIALSEHTGHDDETEYSLFCTFITLDYLYKMSHKAYVCREFFTNNVSNRTRWVCRHARLVSGLCSHIIPDKR